MLLLLESIAELTASGAPLTLTRIARSSGLAKSTTHRLLALLTARRMIESAGGVYRRGPALSDLAGRTIGLPADRLRAALLPHMVDLYELTHETVSLAVVSGTDVVLIERVHGQRNLRSRTSVPDRAPAYATALGHARLTPRAPQPGRSARLAAAVRRQGVFVRTDGVVPGVTCLASPVLDETCRPVAALSVSGRTHRMDIAAAAAHLRAVSLPAGLSLLAEGA
ncbi:IclR family transcriptional regulator [Streptomyces sp. NPDC057301]|uniref:IclR family transcriptional regulator n=1 Tax=Streptomyces sp. NPDC057301 TaxID=3346093 RepID=UPI003640995E